MPIVLRLCALALMMLVAYAGTERLGRPLTDDEKKRFGALLREHDYPGARLVALRFAYKLTHSIGRARELMGRVDLRLVRFGWDPAEVPLKNRLCRLVWSEWTHTVGDTEKGRKAEEAFLRDFEATGAPSRRRPNSRPRRSRRPGRHEPTPWRSSRSCAPRSRRRATRSTSWCSSMRPKTGSTRAT